MTRVDFYQLNPQQANVDRLVCRLCQKAYEKQQLTLLLTRSEQQTAHLDRELWTYSDDSFLPHDAREAGGYRSPILIHSQPEACDERQLLINLTDEIPDFFAQFERIIELVTEDNKQSARQHYSFYKERGYPLKHHNL